MEQDFYLIIPVFNEANNISVFLNSIKTQEKIKLKRIIFIASGCDDNTIPILESESKKHNELELIIEKERTGKAQALNLGIKKVKEIQKSNFEDSIIIFSDGDTKLKNDSLEKLTSYFLDNSIKCVVGHPISIYEKNNKKLLFRISNENFEIWNEIRKTLNEKDKVWPISGYLFATRLSCIYNYEFSKRIAEDACLGIFILDNHNKMKYSEDALVLVKPPNNFSDYIKQKKRTRIGWLQIKSSHPKLFNDLNKLKRLVLLKRILSGYYLSLISFLLDWLILLMAKSSFNNWDKYIIWEPIDSTK